MPRLPFRSDRRLIQGYLAALIRGCLAVLFCLLLLPLAPEAARAAVPQAAASPPAAAASKSPKPPGASGTQASLVSGQGESLTPRQRELWDAARAQLLAVYEKTGRVARPMTRAEVEAPTVPLSVDGKRRGALPWDVRELLLFDRDLFLSGAYDGALPLLGAFPDAAPPEFLTGRFLDILEGAPFSLFSDPALGFTRKRAEALLLKHGGSLPALWLLPGGDGGELPLLWPALSSGGGTSVLHFNHGDAPGFSIKSACLLSYVLEYVIPRDEDAYDRATGADRSRLLTKEENAAVLELLRPKLEELNGVADRVLYYDGQE